MTLTCSTCGLPFGKIENGCLIIESRHHGEKHTNSVALPLVESLLRQNAPRLHVDNDGDEDDWPEFCSQT